MTRRPGSGGPAGRPAVTVPAWLERLTAYSWRFLVVGAAAVTVLLVFSKLRLILFPAILALLVATVLAPPAGWMRERGVPRALVALILVGGSLAVVVGVISVLAPTVTEEVADFGEQLQEGADDAVEWAIHGPLPVDAAQMRQLLSDAGTYVRENAGRITAGVLTGAAVVVEIVAGLLITIVLLFFYLKDGDRLAAWMLARIPPAHREQTIVLARRSFFTLGGFLRGTALVALIDAVGIGLGIWLIGVPLVLPLALLTFVGGFFPIVGANVAGLVAVVVALVSLGLFEAFLTFLVVLGVQQLESNVLEPVIVGRAVSLHPVVVIAAITAGAVVGGIMGAFLAVPAVAVASVIGNELRLRNEAALLVADAKGD